ncbi:MAG: DUF705 domain-containing protein [Thermodesulfovibrionales bacterium]|nr:DUF705 domain-containing protein [Thermodesulfovibrionales bacterium]
MTCPNEVLVACSAAFRTFHNNSIYHGSPGACNVAVFDFDLTIVDDDVKLLYASIWHDIDAYRSIFPYLVLWTHGRDDYIYESMADLAAECQVKFHTVLARNRTATLTTENKGLGAVLKKLNQRYGVSKINFSMLVDDTSSNYTQDYDLFFHIKHPMPDGFYAKVMPKISNLADVFEKYGYLTKHDRIFSS